MHTYYKHYAKGPSKPDAIGPDKVQAGALCGKTMRHGDMYADSDPALRGVACATCPQCLAIRPQKPRDVQWQAATPQTKILVHTTPKLPGYMARRMAMAARYGR